MEKKRDSFFLPGKNENKEKDQSNFSKSNKQENHFRDTQTLNVEKKQNQGENKKPFDKKTYRLKKYSKKYKLEKWEENRKKQVLHKYYKEFKNELPSGTYRAVNFDEDNVDSNISNVGKYVKHPDLLVNEKNPDIGLKGKRDPYLKVKEKFNKMKEEKLMKQKEVEQIKEAKLKKMQEYKKKKQERFKKLSKKTRKGQPVMTGRMELLLEKLQKS